MHSLVLWGAPFLSRLSKEARHLYTGVYYQRQACSRTWYSEVLIKDTSRKFHCANFINWTGTHSEWYFMGPSVYMESVTERSIIRYKFVCFSVFLWVWYPSMFPSGLFCLFSHGSLCSPVGLRHSSFNHLSCGYCLKIENSFLEWEGRCSQNLHNSVSPDSHSASGQGHISMLVRETLTSRSTCRLYREPQGCSLCDSSPILSGILGDSTACVLSMLL